MCNIGTSVGCGSANAGRGPMSARSGSSASAAPARVQRWVGNISWGSLMCRASFSARSGRGRVDGQLRRGCTSHPSQGNVDACSCVCGQAMGSGRAPRPRQAAPAAKVCGACRLLYRSTMQNFATAPGSPEPVPLAGAQVIEQVRDQAMYLVDRHGRVASWNEVVGRGLHPRRCERRGSRGRDAAGRSPRARRRRPLDAPQERRALLCAGRADPQARRRRRTGGLPQGTARHRPEKYAGGPRDPRRCRSRSRARSPTRGKVSSPSSCRDCSIVSSSRTAAPRAATADWALACRSCGIWCGSMAARCRRTAWVLVEAPP